MQKCLLIILLTLLAVTTLYSVPLSKSEDTSIILRAKIEKIPESMFASDVEPPEISHVVLDHKVIEVCRGKYKKNKIRIAYRGGSEKGLVVGDEVFIVIKPTTEFRYIAKVSLRDLGILIPKEHISDFVLTKFIDSKDNKIDSCNDLF